jgi:orotate phosphoribosyltransferase
VREEISEGLLKAKAIYVNLEEPFTFVSGRRSPVYVDCRRLISFPEIRKKITSAFAGIVKNDIGPENVDVLAGGQTAGIPYAAFLAQELDMPMIYVRKEAKGHGAGRQVEGVLEEGQQVALVEDLITDGGSKLNFKKGIEREGAIMPYCLSLYEYRCERLGLREGRDVMEKNKVKLYSLADWDSVLDIAVKKKYFTDGERNEVLEFLKNPDEWGPKRGFMPGEKKI